MARVCFCVCVCLCICWQLRCHSSTAARFPVQIVCVEYGNYFTLTVKKE